jgi:hypothetical protein
MLSLNSIVALNALPKTYARLQSAFGENSDKWGHNFADTISNSMR